MRAKPSAINIAGLTIIAAFLGVAACSALPVTARCAPCVLGLDGDTFAHTVYGAIDGRRVSVLIDTGADQTILLGTCITWLGIEADVAMGLASLEDQNGVVRHGFQMTRVNSLRLGTLEYRDVPSVMVPEVIAHMSVIVGMPIIEKCCWLFDVPNRCVHMLPAGAGASDLAGAGYRAIGVVGVDGGRHPTVRVTLNDECEVPMLVDTGANTSMLPREWTERLGLPDGSEAAKVRRSNVMSVVNNTLGSDVGVHVDPPATGINHGIWGNVYNKLHTVESMSLATARLHDVVVQSHEGNGILAMDFLGSFPWMLDSQRGQLLILERLWKGL